MKHFLNAVGAGPGSPPEDFADLGAPFTDAAVLPFSTVNTGGDIGRAGDKGLWGDFRDCL